MSVLDVSSVTVGYGGIPAITDITVAPYYAQLDQLHPGSKFILTTREKNAWLASMALAFSTVTETPTLAAGVGARLATTMISLSPEGGAPAS